MVSGFHDQATLTVDLAALTTNWTLFKDRCGPDTGATVKANAYGLGLEAVAGALARAGCKCFFVATLAEALALRALQPSSAIYVFSGVDAQSAAVLKRNTIHPVLNTLEQLAIWAATNPAKGAAIHVDTGMNRLGLSAHDTATVRQDPALVAEAGVSVLMTHLACADVADDAATAAQRRRFNEIAGMFPQLTPSVNNSAGALELAGSQPNIARPGIGLYGGNPRPALDMPLHPVVTVTAPILQLRTLQTGESVGYGAAFTVPKKMRSATIGIGYADGVPRSIGPAGHVLIDGRACKILGRISMDSLAVDVTNVDAACVGGQAEILGKISVNEMAQWAGTISYEILTGLGMRLERRYVR